MNNDEAFISRSKKIRFTLATDLIRKRLIEEIPAANKNFDGLYKCELDQIDPSLSRVLFVLGASAEENLSDHKKRCWALIGNAAHGVLAAIEILRNGHGIQTGVVLRNVVESLCYCLHIVQRPKDLSKYDNGKLKWGTAFHTVKVVAPPLGDLYPLLSEMFVHVQKSDLQRSVNLFLHHDHRDTLAEMNLQLICMSTAALAIVAEGALFHWTPNPRYWQLKENKLIFSPTSDAEQELARLLEQE